MIRKLVSYILIFVMVFSNIAFDYTKVYASATPTISFTRGGTITHPTVDVTVNTEGLEIAQVTYERGYNKTATRNSKKFYGVEGKTDMVTFSLDDVTKHVSVMVTLYDESDHSLTDIEGKFEITGKRAFNSGSESFAIYPTTALTDVSVDGEIYSDKVDNTSFVQQEGPILYIDDEVWIFDQNGNYRIYNSEGVDDIFVSTNNITPIDTGKIEQFHYYDTSIIYDGRYIFIVSSQASNKMQIIDASTRTLVSASNIIKDLPTGKTWAAITYDNEKVYIYEFTGYSSVDNIYIFTPYTEAGQNYAYTYEKTVNLPYTGHHSFLQDMIFDGEKIWTISDMHNYSKSVMHTYDIASGDIEAKILNTEFSRLTYDGVGNIYISRNNYSPNSWLYKIDKSDTSMTPTQVYDNVSGGTQVSPSNIAFDGKNIWYAFQHSSATTYDDKTYYDPDDDTRKSISTTNWDISGEGLKSNVSRNYVYDGKYLWSFNGDQTVHVVGSEQDLNYELELDTSEVVLIENIDESNEIKVKSGKSTSDIVYGAWVYDETSENAQTRDKAFFNDVSNFVGDATYGADYTKYSDKVGKYFPIENAKTTVDSEKNFSLEFETLPRKNGFYTLYTVNKQGASNIETIEVTNYREASVLNVVFEEKTSKDIIFNVEENHLVGDTVTVDPTTYLAELKKIGYKLVDGASKNITLNNTEETLKFEVELDKTLWTEIIIKPFEVVDGSKSYIGDEIATGDYYLITDSSVTDEANYKTAEVLAPHINDYNLKSATDAVQDVKLPPNKGGTATSYGRVEVEIEYVKGTTEKCVLVKGIEVDEDNKPTGNIIYTEHIVGNEGDTKSVTAKTSGVDNWDFVGLANYDGSGTFTNITSGTSSKNVTLGTDEEVAFAYKRKMATVTVKYKSSGNEITSSDTFKVALGTDYTAVGKAVAGYQLVDSTQYLKTETISSSNYEIVFDYKRLTETIIIEAIDVDTDEVITRIGKNYDLGVNVTINSDTVGLDSLVSPRYKISGSNSKFVTIADDLVVQFYYEQQSTAVTVNYLDSDDNEIAPSKTYNVIYGDTINETPISIENYYYDVASDLDSDDNLKNPTITETANSDKREINFRYKKSEGSVAVIAKDTGGNILAYKLHTGEIGKTYTAKAGDEFSGETFLGDYSLKSSNEQTGVFSSTNTEIVFLYEPITYEIYIKLKDVDGEAVTANGVTERTFTYKKSENYYIYAPVAEGYKTASGTDTYFSGDYSNAGATHTFVYDIIDETVNLGIKAISDDGVSLIGSKIATGTRNEKETIKISDHTDLWDSEMWQLNDTNSKDITYGVDNEAVFKFNRKQVSLTVNHIDEDTKEILSTETISVNTKSNITVVNALDNSKLANYELSDSEKISKTIYVGTSNSTAIFNYKKGVGSVVLEAVDVNGKILERKFYDGHAIDEKVTLDKTDLARDLEIHSNDGYTLNEGTSTLEVTVTSDIKNNLMIANYDDVKAKVVVEYKDEDEISLALPSEYPVRYGEFIIETPINVDYYNIVDSAVTPKTTSSSAIVNTPTTVFISNVHEDFNIVFHYEKVDYTKFADGVINVIAKDEDGNVLGFVPYRGKIGEEARFTASNVFGTIVGYELLGNDDERLVTYEDGYVNLEYIYKMKQFEVNVVAKDKDGKALTFTADNKYTVQEGKDITIFAPIISGYKLVGDEKQTFTNITEVKTATFIYEPVGEIVVIKGIEVDEDGKETGNTVYSIIEHGNELEKQTFSAKDGLDNWELKGLANVDNTGAVTSIDSTSKSKSVTFGTDEEVVFAYERKYIEITATYEEKGTGTPLGQDSYTVPLNSELTINAKAIEGYKLVDSSTFQETFTANSTNASKKFIYEKLGETVILEARLDSKTGELLAQATKDIPLGTENIDVYATDLISMLGSRYTLDTTLTPSKYTISKVDENTVVTYVFKEQISTVTIKYKEYDGTTTGKDIGIADKVYEVPYGSIITETAKSINDYYLNTSASDANYIVKEALQPNYEYTFFYTKGNGAITVLAKDYNTGEILYYKTYKGVQGESLTIDESVEFSNKEFYDYYTLYKDLNPSSTQTMNYTNKHQEMIFSYKEDVYTVTINAIDVDSKESINFFDGTTTKTFEYKKGDKYSIYAPPITDYIIPEGGVTYISDQDGILANRSYTFEYRKADLNTNLSVKAIGKDENGSSVLIGSKLLSGDRGVVETIKIADYSDLYDSDEWQLVSADSVTAMYGTDIEVIFEFERKTVNVLVKYVDENGSEIQSDNYQVHTNTPFTAVAKVIDGYSLKPAQSQVVTKDITTSDETITFNYVKSDGNITIEAIDADTGEVLAKQYAKEDEGKKYTVDSSIFDSNLVGYTFDSTNPKNKLEITVSASADENVLQVVYKKDLANIIVRYVNEDGDDIVSAKTYTAQYGHSLTEYAINIEYYNLKNNDDYKFTINEVTGDLEIKFVYYLVEYTVVTEGVINIIAKTTEGKVLDVKSFEGSIGSSRVFEANMIFGSITGYTLQKGTTEHTAIFKNGVTNIEFIYEISSLTIEIDAIDSIGNTLTFTEPNTLYQKEGDDVTVYAPHIMDYDVVGYEIENGLSGTESYVQFKEISKNEKIVFKYQKIDVPSTIYVKHISYVNGHQVEIETETKEGNIGEIISITPKDFSSIGYTIDGNYDVTKIVTFGVDKEVVFLYDRNMNSLTLNFNINEYEDRDAFNNGTILYSVNENDKVDKTSEFYAPQLLNRSEKLEVNSYRTIIVPFDEKFVLDLSKTGGSTPPLIENVQMTSNIIKDYYYRNILGDILIRAVVEDENGTLSINGKNYTLLAQVDDFVTVGAEYNNATNKNKELMVSLSPSYTYVELLDGQETFTQVAGETYKDHIITYLYTGEYKEVQVSYVDENGQYISPSLLGLSSNPMTYEYLTNTSYSQYALNVNNYNFIEIIKTLENGEISGSYTSGIVEKDGEIKIQYDKIDFNTEIAMIGAGARATIPMLAIVGQKIPAPYIEGYEPDKEFVIVGSNIEPQYVFNYTELEPETKTRIVYDTNTEYKYKDKIVTQYETEYVGDAKPFVHEPFIHGYEDGTVKPDGNITRSEVVSILYNVLFDEDVKSTKNVMFNDVTGDEWYAEKLYYLAGLDYIYGYEDGSFRPDGNITREEVAAIMSRIFGDGYVGEIDGLSIENYWATNNIIDSYGSGFYKDMDVTAVGYDWKKSSSRAEVIVMMNNALERVPNENYLNTVVVPLDLYKSHWAYYHVLEAITHHEGYYEGNFGREKEIIKDFNN